MSAARLPHLIETHRERVYRAAFRLLGNTEDALDVAQETFARLSAHLATVTDARAGAWLARVATNRALDMLRRRDPLRHAQGIDAAHALPAVACPAAWTDEPRDRVLNAVASLPPRQAEIVSLRIHDDRSFADIARTLGISEGATKTHFRRGLESLRTKLAGLAPDDQERRR